MQAAIERRQQMLVNRLLEASEQELVVYQEMAAELLQNYDAQFCWRRPSH